MGIRVQFALFARDKHVSRDQDLWLGNLDKGRGGGERQADKQTDGVGEKDKERRKKKKENNSVRKH